MGVLKPNEVTNLLFKWSEGSKEALEQLMPIVYQELHQIAGGYLRRERPDHTLQPTALINEAYMRLIDQSLPQWQSRAHFFGVAARLMRQILVEHARRNQAAKRGGQDQKVSLEETLDLSKVRAAELVALDDALTALAGFDERKARVIELRYFGGLSIEETAELLGVSMPTIGREQRLAEAWLERELQR